MPSILVVEDDKDAREGYLEFLSCSGFEAVGVGDGCEALNIAIATLPAAVITDISIPGLNGFDLAAILRRERLTRHIPIIGLTGHWSTDVQMKAAESKMAAVRTSNRGSRTVPRTAASSPFTMTGATQA